MNHTHVLRTLRCSLWNITSTTRNTAINSNTKPCTVLKHAHVTFSSPFPVRSFMTTISTWSKHEYPPLDEAELEEDFVQGSGPGGQSVNRTMNCVVLKHVPTGVVVKCHESRSLETNRKRARERLQERLDFHYHGDESYLLTKKREDSQKLKEKKRRANLRLEKKRAFKEREGLSKSASEDDDS